MLLNNYYLKDPVLSYITRFHIVNKKIVFYICADLVVNIL